MNNLFNVIVLFFIFFLPTYGLEPVDEEVLSFNAMVRSMRQNTFTGSSKIDLMTVDEYQTFVKSILPDKNTLAEDLRRSFQEDMGIDNDTFCEKLSNMPSRIYHASGFWNRISEIYRPLDYFSMLLVLGHKATKADRMIQSSLSYFLALWVMMYPSVIETFHLMNTSRDMMMNASLDRKFEGGATTIALYQLNAFCASFPVYICIGVLYWTCYNLWLKCNTIRTNDYVLVDEQKHLNSQLPKQMVANYELLDKLRNKYISSEGYELVDEQLCINSEPEKQSEASSGILDWLRNTLIRSEGYELV